MSKAKRLYTHNQSGEAFLQTLYARQLIFLRQAIKRDINLILNKKIGGTELMIESKSEDAILALPLGIM